MPSICVRKWALPIHEVSLLNSVTNEGKETVFEVKIFKLYKKRRSISMKPSDVSKIAWVGALTLGLATMPLTTPTSAQTGGGSAGTASGTGTGSGSATSGTGTTSGTGSTSSGTGSTSSGTGSTSSGT